MCIFDSSTKPLSGKLLIVNWKKKVYKIEFKITLSP